MRIFALLFSVSLLLSAPAYGERFASPVFSPWKKPDTNPECTLYVYVKEFPRPGKYMMSYSVSSLRRAVELNLDDTTVSIKPGEPHTSEVGQLFNENHPLTISKISATYGGFFHCAGSPFDVNEFVKRRSSERLYADLYDRKPQEKEYLEAWGGMSVEERRRIIADMFKSKERQYIEIRGYIHQFLGPEHEQSLAPVLLRKHRNLRATLAEIVSTSTYFEKAGGTHTDFVSGLYWDLLGTEPDKAEEEKLVKRLQKGTSLRNIARQLINEPAFRKRLVEIWWKAFLDRAPREDELKEALKKLKEGTSWEILQADILARDEYYQRSTVTRIEP